MELESGATVEVERREERGGLEEGGFKGEVRLGGEEENGEGRVGQGEAEGGWDCRPEKQGSEGNQSP